MMLLNVYIGNSIEGFKQSICSRNQGKCSRHVSKEFEVIIYQPQTSPAICMYVI